MWFCFRNLNKSLKLILSIIHEIQKNKIFEKTINCEPFFTKYNLVRSTRGKYNNFETDLSNLAAYTDRNYDEYELSKLLNISKKEVKNKLSILKRNKLIKEFF